MARYGAVLMEVQVKLFATLRKYAPAGSPAKQDLELADGSTIRQALEQLGVPEPQIAFVFVNSKRQKLDQPLADGDELGVFPPMAGG